MKRTLTPSDALFSPRKRRCFRGGVRRRLGVRVFSAQAEVFRTRFLFGNNQQVFSAQAEVFLRAQKFR